MHPSPADTRTLVVVRHARADDPTGDDHERPLTEAGAAAAVEAGRWLRAQGVDPAYALVSSARRTLETWAALAQGARWDVRAEADPVLYSAGVETALDLVHEIDESVFTTVLVGHNPTVAMLATLLPDGTGEARAEQALATSGFPPCSVAVFHVQGSWWDVREGRAQLVAHHIGGHED